MTAPDQHPAGEIAIVARIGQEIRRAERQRRQATALPLGWKRAWRTPAVAVLGVLLAVTGAAATGALLAPGTVIPGSGEESGGPPGFRLPVDETVLATGTAPVAGPWRVSAYREDGVSCLRLLLLRPPAGTLIAGRSSCGELGRDGFGASSLGVRNEAGRAEILLFGRAPASSTAVALSAANGEELRSQTQGTASSSGDAWALPVPPATAKDAELVWIDATGQRRTVALDPRVVDAPGLHLGQAAPRHRATGN